MIINKSNNEIESIISKSNYELFEYLIKKLESQIKKIQRIENNNLYEQINIKAIFLEINENNTQSIYTIKALLKYIKELIKKNEELKNEINNLNNIQQNIENIENKENNQNINTIYNNLNNNLISSNSDILKIQNNLNKNKINKNQLLLTILQTPSLTEILKQKYGNNFFTFLSKENCESSFIQEVNEEINEYLNENKTNFQNKNYTLEPLQYTQPKCNTENKTINVNKSIEKIRKERYRNLILSKEPFEKSLRNYPQPQGIRQYKRYNNYTNPYSHLFSEQNSKEKQWKD